MRNSSLERLIKVSWIGINLHTIDLDQQKSVCNWNEILGNWLRAHPCDSAFLLLSSSSRFYWQKTNSQMVVLQPLFIYIRLFRLHVHFLFAGAVSQWDVKESEGTQFLIISTFFPLFQLFIDWIYLFFKEEKRSLLNNTIARLFCISSKQVISLNSTSLWFK